MEQGPITTSSRSSLPAMMFWMALRVRLMSPSTGVPRMGKKRIRCSGGGSTVMSLMRSSSVWLVLSTGFACQASVAAAAFGVMAGLLGGGGIARAKKNRRGYRRLLEGLFAFLAGTL